MQPRRPSVAVIVGTAIALLGMSAGIAAAAPIPGTDGTIHGCYNTRSGALRVIDPAAGACTRQETGISWQEQGPQGDPGQAGPPIESLAGVPCTSPGGDGTIRVLTSEGAQGISGGGMGYPMSLTCQPNGDFLGLEVYGLGTVSISPAPAVGGDACVGDHTVEEGTPVVCVRFYPTGTAITLTAVPDPGQTIHPVTWANIAVCTPGAATCTFTLTHPGRQTVAGFTPTP